MKGSQEATEKNRIKTIAAGLNDGRAARQRHGALERAIGNILIQIEKERKKDETMGVKTNEELQHSAATTRGEILRRRIIEKRKNRRTRRRRTSIRISSSNGHEEAATRDAAQNKR